MSYTQMDAYFSFGFKYYGNKSFDAVYNLDNGKVCLYVSPQDIPHIKKNCVWTTK